MNSSNLNILIVFSLILFLLLSCSEGTVYQEPESNYSGVIETDSTGKKLDSVDVDDDWVPECFEIVKFGDNLFCIYTAYPNPSKDFIKLGIAPQDTLDVLITLHLSDSDTLKTLFNSEVFPGNQEIQFSFDNSIMERNKIYRVYIEATDPKSGDTQTSYGDVMWE